MVLCRAWRRGGRAAPPPADLLSPPHPPTRPRPPRRLGHPTAHFNVGKYRRKQANRSEVQDASFFDIRWVGAPAGPRRLWARHGM